MDTGTTIIGIIILLLCILPLVIMTRKANQKERQFSRDLFDFAKKSNSKLSEHEIMNNIAIGLDKENNQLFFLRKKENIEAEFQINLLEIQKCRVLNSNRTVNSKEGNYKVIDKLALAFTYLDKNKQETVLDFYKSELNNFSLNGELQLIEKWLKIINDLLMENKTKNSSATSSTQKPIVNQPAFG